jgi:hypothetical protein
LKDVCAIYIYRERERGRERERERERALAWKWNWTSLLGEHGKDEGMDEKKCDWTKTIFSFVRVFL